MHYVLYFLVPETHLEMVKNAVFATGAGKIGHYSHCAWQTLGQGQFMPLAGVHAANLDGMRRAVQGLDRVPAYVLTDGYAIEGLGIPNLAVWKGDQVVVTISAASIIAKVTRDRIMREMDKDFPLYGLAAHKGYITAAHTKALNEHGPCIQHRRSFANIAALINKG